MSSEPRPKLHERVNAFLTVAWAPMIITAWGLGILVAVFSR